MGKYKHCVVVVGTYFEDRPWVLKFYVHILKSSHMVNHIAPIQL